MLVYLILSLFTVLSMLLITLLRVNEIGKKLYLIFNFILLYIFLALRFDYGNDYESYFEIFEDYGKYHILVNTSMEPGWIFINKLFAFSNFFTLIAFTALFYCVSTYLIIKNHVSSKYYWLAIFLLLFIPSNFLINLSIMRQSIAISFFTFLVFKLIERNYIKATFYGVLAFFFHKTIILTIAITLLVYWSRNIKNFAFIILGYLTFLIFLSLNDLLYSTLRPYLLLITDKFEVYNSSVNFSIGFGVIYQIILFTTLNYFAKDINNISTRFLLRLSTFGYILIPLIMIDENLVRISFYFEFLLIISIPKLIKSVGTNDEKVIILLLIAVWYIYSVYGFFGNPVWIEKYTDYKTIFMS